jgi:prepilin-type N-terminal cleavage/methylation domain-containing protein
MYGRNRESEKGFTLIELLTASAIGAMLLTTLAVATGGFLDNFSSTLDEQDLALAHHIALERMLTSITMASEVDVQNSMSIQATFPDGGTETFAWSGSPGDPLTLSRDGGDENPLADGMVNLNFVPNTTNVIEESFEVLNEQLFCFEGYSSYTYVWEDMVLADGAVHGLTLMIPYVAEVEQMILQSMDVRIGKLAGQGAAIKISLYEGQSEERPRVWDEAIATHIVPNYDIPEATYSGTDLVIDWMTVDLPESFAIQPNRFYCILFESEGVVGGEAGYLRVANIPGGTGPINSMAYMGSTDGGSTWYPTLQTQEYRQKDVPLRLNGEVTIKIRTISPRVESVDVTLGLIVGHSNVTGKGRAYVRGGGDVRYN